MTQFFRELLIEGCSRVLFLCDSSVMCEMIGEEWHLNFAKTDVWSNEGEINFPVSFMEFPFPLHPYHRNLNH